VSQSGRIQLADGKDSDATLRAAFAADEPVAALLRGFGQGFIYDLDQRAVLLGQCGGGHKKIIPGIWSTFRRELRLFTFVERTFVCVCCVCQPAFSI